MRPYELLKYSYPTLSKGKTWFVSFMCYDEKRECYRRKRYKLAHIKDLKQRVRFANRLIYELMNKLDKGWNPWSDEKAEVTYTVDSVFESYLAFIIYEYEHNNMRKDTIKSYKSYLNVLRRWLSSEQKIKMCHEFSHEVATKFLDYVYVGLRNSVTTRNNYLVWLNNFCTWCFDHGYMKTKPTEGIKHLPKAKDKQRTIIDDFNLVKLRQYCEQNNKHFLLVCHLIYYCFIRPKELSYIRIGDIKLKDGVITVSSDIAKNHRRASVTLPAKVIHHMVDLGIFSHPSSDYLFSENFSPGANYQPPKRMSDFWHYHVAKDLSFPESFKLYSLKDTGITKRLHSIDALSVRDQARHSDISITNIYAHASDSACQAFRDVDDIL